MRVFPPGESWKVVVNRDGAFEAVRWNGMSDFDNGWRTHDYGPYCREAASRQAEALEAARRFMAE